MNEINKSGSVPILRYFAFHFSFSGKAGGLKARDLGNGARFLASGLRKKLPVIATCHGGVL